MASDRRRDLLTLGAVLLPLLAIALLIARAELVMQSGVEWAVRIEGYDPRDLLAGNYLRYRIDWGLQESRCSGAGCCYCLWGEGRRDAAAPPPVPAASLLRCEDRAPCESWFPVEASAGLEKFFIPEDKGPALEQAIRAHKATLLLRVTSRGRVGIADLLLDGKPWREVAK